MPLNRVLILQDGRAGVFAGTKVAPRIGGLGFQVDSLPDQVERQFGPFHEATVAGVHTQGSRRKTAKFPNMLAAGPAKLRPTPDAKGLMSKAAKRLFDPNLFLVKVGEGKTILNFEKNAVVFSQGDVADTVFYLQKGRIKVLVVSEQGKEAVVGIMEPGQFFGEGCLNGHPLRISTTTAMDECVVTSITKTAMLAALKNEPKFSELFMAYLLSRNSRIEEDLIDQLFNSSEKRLARLLLLLANFGKDGAPQPITTQVSQETLAEMIGTTRSRVSFFMNKFRKLGFITYNGKIEVHSSLLNAVLYDKPEIKSGE